MENGKRIVWIDVLKGALLVLTCSSHFIERPVLIDYILRPVSSCYVPMFFVVSGFLCKEMKNEKCGSAIRNLFLKKTRTMLLPYFFFSAIALVYEIFLGHFEKAFFQCFFVGSSCGFATPMWFVGSLFVVSVVYIPILWVCKPSKKSGLVLISLLVLLSVLIKNVDFEMPWHLKNVFSLGVFFVSGYWLRLHKCKKNLASYFLLLLLLGFGCYGLLVLVNNEILKMASPICLFAFVKFTHDLAPINIDIKPLRWVAVNGIVILGAHNFVYHLFHGLAKRIALLQNSSTLFFMFSFISCFLICYLLIVPFVNTYLYRIFGKKKMAWNDNYKI